eukprot:GHVP01032625.1.p1 GENE.GHVP01032625.1~~GHVP01032625.1.p1  ORF type:complete len:400 (+),score=88.34 GHVP01032625.1:2112-3311(+)
MPKPIRKERKKNSHASPIHSKKNKTNDLEEEEVEATGEDEFGFRQKNSLGIKAQNKLFDVARDQLLEDDRDFLESGDEMETQSVVDDPFLAISGVFEDTTLESIEKDTENFLAPEDWSRQFITTLADSVSENLYKINFNLQTHKLDESQLEKKKLMEEVFSNQIRQFLKFYRAEKVPKAVRLIPRLENWEEILEMTCPEEWSNQAMKIMTIIFASAQTPRMVVKFYRLVLLPRVKKVIRNRKRLDAHLYYALKKAFYKPSAWFSGILLPLSEEGCTMQEALVVGSVLSKMSVPAVHAAACLVALASQKTWFAPTSYFLSIILQKAYSLPLTVIEAIADHFHRFIEDLRHLPVLWHQSLLCFLNNYGGELDKQRKENILLLVKKHHHHLITPAIRGKLPG